MQYFFQAQTPQALKQFYEKNAKLAPRIPSGTSPQFTHLLVNLLKRDAKDRIDFEAFFNHPFLERPQPKQQQPASEPAQSVAVPGARGGDPPGMLPPSPATTQGLLVRPATPRTSDTEKSEVRMETSETQEPVKPQKVRKQSPSTSPDTDQDNDFVLVPNSLAGDSSRNKNMHAG